MISRPIVHLELHTSDRAEAGSLYADLLGWQPERVGSYMTLDLGCPIGGGIVECGARRAVWLPYVAVDRVEDATARACELGATVLLEPREGPAGWRSVVSTPAGGELAFWQSKATG